MLIDHTQRPMIRLTALLAAGATLLFGWECLRNPSRPSGGTWPGLVFGGSALAIMLFCAGLALKRRVPHWRIGPARAWLRGHVWLGLLSVLLVAYHAAFRIGGALTTWLWILLGLVTISALFGVILQQFIPRLLLHAVPKETLAQQIPRQRDNLRRLMEEVVGGLTGGQTSPTPDGTEMRAQALQAAHEQVVARAAERQAAAQAGTAVATEEPDQGVEELAALDPMTAAEPVRRFYHDYLSPFFRGDSRTSLHSRRRSETLFTTLRTMTPPDLHEGIGELEDLTERRRQLIRQDRLMKSLMGWLVVHVPLSWALLVLTIVHAVGALRYGRM